MPPLDSILDGECCTYTPGSSFACVSLLNAAIRIAQTPPRDMWRDEHVEIDRRSRSASPCTCIPADERLGLLRVDLHPSAAWPEFVQSLSTIVDSCRHLLLGCYPYSLIHKYLSMAVGCCGFHSIPIQSRSEVALNISTRTFQPPRPPRPVPGDYRMSNTATFRRTA